MQCVILAGGLGTRMLPRTSSVPKCLLPVGGRPFADWQLSWLESEGIQRVVYCIGHLGHLVKGYVRDGSAWKLDVTYVDEGEQLLGTAGALRLGLDQGVLEEEFFVLYGDSHLSVNLASVEEAHKSSVCPVLMTVFRNVGNWEASNVIFDGHAVCRYQKNCPEPPVDMIYVDYGLLAFERQVIEHMVPAGVTSDLAPILERLSVEGRVAGYEAQERFYEIGSLEGLRSLEEHLDHR